MTELQCISPIDGSVYARRPASSMQHALEVIEKSNHAAKKWRALPLETRIEYVVNAVEHMAQSQEKTAEHMAWMMGRPKHQFGEFKGCLERTHYMASIAKQCLSDDLIQDDAHFTRKLVREPHGIVFVIAPWNYPYLTAINTIVPALIAGNTVILKHATQTLLVGEHMETAFLQSGLPEDVFQNIFLQHDTASELIHQGHFGFINFTGSVAGGAAIEKAAAGTFTPVGTELGGKDPAYVMQDADIDAAVASLVEGAFFNSGQCCCGIERIYVHAKCYDEFLDKAVTAASKLTLGNPLNAETTIGPMANIRFANEVRKQIEQAISQGAVAMLPKELFPEDDGGAYLAPQIMTNVNHTMDIMREESFGPVVGIMKVHSDDEAITLMNDCQYGLTVSLWTGDAKRAEDIGVQLDTGTVFMNRCDYLDPALCWTGRKNTGCGGTLSKIGYANLTRPKSYHLRKTI